MSAAYAKWDPIRAAQIVAGHSGREGSLIPILHDLQHEFGHVPDDAVPIVAEALNVSRADVHGVVTFYHDFRRVPAGDRVVKLCQAEACQARGARALAAHAEAKLGVPMGETKGDGSVTLEPIYCLGLCASGPSALIDGRPYARLDEKAFDRVVEASR